MKPPRGGIGEKLEGEGEVDEREERAQAKRTAFEALQHSRTLLPMYEHKEGLLRAIAEFQTLVIVGETGSGKTTQVPLLGRTPPTFAAAASAAHPLLTMRAACIS